MTKSVSRNLDKVLTLTPSLRRQATEFLLSRGFLSYGKEDHKVRALGILLRDGDEFDVASLTGMNAIPLQTVAKSLEVLASGGAIKLVSDRKYRLNLEAPVAVGYYEARGARFFRIAALDERKAARNKGAPPQYRVLRTWKDLADRPSVTFIVTNEFGVSKSVATSASEAFRTFAKLRREVSA